MSAWGPWDPSKPEDDELDSDLWRASEEIPPPVEPEDDLDYGWGEYPAWPVSGPSWSEYPAYLEPETHPRTPERRSHDPLGKLFPGLPRGARVFLDWALTIAGAILIVLVVKHWVVNPYRIPSSSMEPTLNCAKPGTGCLGTSSDRVLACRICLAFSSPSRGEVVVFNTPPAAGGACGEAGTFVKRIVGLPGEAVKEDKHGFIYIRGPNSILWKKLNEPYLPRGTEERDIQTNPDFRGRIWKVPEGDYFMMGDNRSFSCDSRRWGSVPRANLIGNVFFIYWPPDRITDWRWIVVVLGGALLLLALLFSVGRKALFP